MARIIVKRSIGTFAASALLAGTMLVAAGSVFAEECKPNATFPYQGCNRGNITGMPDAADVRKNILKGEGFPLRLHPTSKGNVSDNAFQGTSATDPGEIPASKSDKPAPGGPGSGEPKLPFSPPGGGGGGGGDGDGDDDGDGGNCSDAPGTCPVRGDLVDIGSNDGASNECGLTVPLSFNWLTTVRNQTGALIVKQGNLKLEAYERAGRNLHLRETSDIPGFYCILLPGEPRPVNPGDPEPPPQIKKIPIVPDEQYQAIRNSSQFAYLAMRTEEGGAIAGNLIMKRIGQTLKFEASPPNPAAFAGATGDATDCRVYNELFGPLPPDFEGITLSGVLKNKGKQCNVDQFGVSAATYPECKDMLHYMSVPGFFFEPGKPVNSGQVIGGSMNGQALIQPNAGLYEADPNGDLQYTGTFATFQSGGSFFISIGPQVEDYSFTTSFQLKHSSDYIINSNLPGRIRVFTNGQVQFLDGGWVTDSNGNRIRNIAPNGSVQFETNEAIQGILGGAMVLDPSNLIPVDQTTTTSGMIPMRAPFDTSTCTQ